MSSHDVGGDGGTPGAQPERPPAPSTDEPELRRPLTIDDVPRLGSGTGVAVGCAVVVVAAVLLFWLVRGWLMRAN
ncbi:MAG TPA: hypothetical protein VF881_15750 [Polyangiaceae bacterium]